MAGLEKPSSKRKRDSRAEAAPSILKKPKISAKKPRDSSPPFEAFEDDAEGESSRSDSDEAQEQAEDELTDGRDPQDIEEDEDKTFKELGIVDELCEACENLGYKNPTPIQVKSIPVALQGRDIIGLAETGSGKTAAFALPMLQALLENSQPLFGLILVPTRELAVQISNAFGALGTSIGLRSTVIVGGLDMVTQAIALAKKPHIVVATPGRLWDHIENTKGFHLRNLKYLVLDEADKVLDLDFGPVVDKILRALPKERRTYLFSATMSSKVESLQRACLRNPVHVNVTDSKYKTPKTLITRLLVIPAAERDLFLIYLLKSGDFYGRSTIVFVRNIHETYRLSFLLRSVGITAIPLNGQLTQPKRQGALDSFRAGTHDVLVATDIAARGLDIQSVNLVLNYHLPTDSKTYIHRIGRTARAGKSGYTISFATQYDAEVWLRLEHTLGEKYPVYENAPREAVLELQGTVGELQRLAKNKMKEMEMEKGRRKKGLVSRDGGRRGGPGGKGGFAKNRDDMDREEKWE